MEVAAIIPAYNEEKNIAQVLSCIYQMEELSEILVVSDGSTDRTVETAHLFGVRTIELPYNQGKSYAMKTGLQSTTAPIVLFLDADLIGLKKHHVRSLISPLIDGVADMTLGIFTSGRNVTDLAQKIAPFLTGQRAVKRWILEDLNQEEWTSGFGIEVALTRYARENKLKVSEVYLENVTHVMKEEKLGLAKGVAARIKMYWEIAKEINRF